MWLEEEAGDEVEPIIDCPICLETMTEADHKHPMQCTSENCCYNFCMTCIESLITSSKDDYMEASDGNRHVKVSLHCPNCRSDLGQSIRDTLLLRKVDFVLMNEDLEDSELTPSQLRMKHVLHDTEVQKAISIARWYEANFFGTQIETEEKKEEENDDSSSSSSSDEEYTFEEWGVEADLTHGVHKSIRLPPGHKLVKKKNPTSIDKTLLSGLECSMSQDEQRLITELMTSGDTAKLASAAKMLSEILKTSIGGVPLKKRLMKLSSIYGLIDECEQAHQKGPSNTTSNNVATKQVVQQTRRVSRISRRRVSLAKNKAAARMHAEFMNMHPLPVRMPKYAEFSLPTNPHHALSLKFMNDKWDGTVKDAFSKITVIPFGETILKQFPSKTHPGVLNVLSEGYMNPDSIDSRIDVEKDRVIVKSINQECGRQGVMRGDVVTHLDDEKFKGNAADLVKAIQEKAKNSGGEKKTFAVVFNAEQPIAEALKRRGNISW